jgi:hypothetical protein
MPTPFSIKVFGSFIIYLEGNRMANDSHLVRVDEVGHAGYVGRLVSQCEGGQDNGPGKEKIHDDVRPEPAKPQVGKRLLAEI